MRYDAPPLDFPLKVTPSLKAEIETVQAFRRELLERRKWEGGDVVGNLADKRFGSGSEGFKNKAFLILLQFLVSEWDTKDRPLWALEELVVDFRSASLVLHSKSMLLQAVAGIAEYDGEPEWQYKRRQDFFLGLLNRELETLGEELST